MDVLQLDVSGRPQAWITPKEAAVIYASDGVAWTLGDACHVLRGGIQRATGRQSRIEVHAIIAVRGSVPSRAWRVTPTITNSKLFVRDRNICAYCGQQHHEESLTREHIVPFAQNGVDTWMNVVTACRACNHRKSNRTPEQALMPLLYAPYVPSLWEDFILRNRRILADQMEFLMTHLPKSSRLMS